ncbi:MAG: DMT family transporter [Betaproteobacteria bacterium]|nr:MAG: DMT family transporter [Betaproteobacteria bacterium]
MSQRDAFDFVLLSAIWGTSFLFMRVSAPEFGPFALIGLRAGIAACCLLPLFLLHEGVAPLAAHAPALTTVGLVNCVIPFTLLAYAALSLTAGFTALLNATTPLWAAVVGVFWLGATLTRRQWIGLALGVIGMVVLTWGKVDFKPGGTGLAVVAALIATLSYGFSNHFTKKNLSALSPLGVAAGSQAAGAVMILPFAIYFWPETPPSMRAWLAAISLAVLATAFALVLYFRLISQLGGQKASAVTFLIPVFAAAFGALFLGEAVTLPMWTGGLIVVAGTALILGLIPSKTPRKQL